MKSVQAQLVGGMGAARAAGSPPPAAQAAAAAAVGGGGGGGFDSDEDGGLPPIPEVPTPSFLVYATSDNKPFLGGYRNPATGVVFHNATTQTDPLPRPRPVRPRRPLVAAAAQTEKPHRSRGFQCPRDAATQCPRPGCAEDREGRMLELTGGQACEGSTWVGWWV